MSAWEAISVALGSGAAGTVIGTLLNNNHQRAAELRNMRLTASTEFIRRADTAIRFLRRPHPDAHDDDPFNAAADMWDQLAEAVQVIHLLFGPDCEPSEWARTTSNEIHDARQELLGIIKAKGTSAQPIEVHLGNAQEALDLFTATARAVIWESRWLRPRGRLLAAMHKLAKHPASAEVPPAHALPASKPGTPHPWPLSPLDQPALRPVDEERCKGVPQRRHSSKMPMSPLTCA